MRESICAVVTTYFPEDILLENMKRVSLQVDTIVIVDNTATQASKGILTSLEEMSSKIVVIKNGKNEGTITALNQGIRKAAELGHHWVFTLDQDSLVDPQLIQTYLDFVKKIDAKHLGIINSNYKDKDTGLVGFSLNTANQNGWAEVRALITSGSFFAVSTFQEIGPMREEFFMDWADYDFCLRARRFGKRNYVYIPPLIVHSIGAKTAHKFLFWELPANHHNAFRCYLIGRNLTVVIKEYFFKEFPMVMFFIGILFYKVLSVVLWEQKRRAKLKNFFLGIKDGVLNRLNDHWRYLKELQK